MSLPNEKDWFCILCVIVSLSLSFGLKAQDTNEEHKDRAKDLIETLGPKFQDKAAVEANLTNPLTGGSSFSTLDGTKSFNQRLACPSSAHFLEVFFGIGSGGNLAPIIVQQDSNFDGSYDHNFTMPLPVSGICANGVISCEGGSWNGCRHFLWSGANDGRIGITEGNLADMAGCYCVNDSCGSGLGFGNRNTILDDLGGGIAGALMQQDPRYAISAVNKQDFIIQLSGQDTRACGPEQATPQHQYFDNPVLMSGDAYAAAGGDPLYSIISNIPSGDDALRTQNSCRIERQVTLDEVLGTDIINRVTSSPDYDESACAGDPDCFQFGLGDGEDNNIRASSGCQIFSDNLIWNIDRIDNLTEATLLGADYEDQIAVFVNGQLIYSTGGFNGSSDPSDCQINDQASVSINRSFKSALQVGRNELLLKIAVKDKGSGRIFGRIRYEPSCELIENIGNTCAPYAENDQCRLIEETVDGVKTFQNGGRTGLTPLGETRTLYGAKCTETFSRAWFERDRGYECETDADGAMSFDFTRQAHIYQFSNIDQFADRQLGSDGSVIATTGDYTIDTDYGIATCEQICKTRIEKDDNEVSSTGVVGDVLNNPEYTEFNYHQCSAGVCPAGPGETVVEECGCLNEFPQALAMMQTFRLAGKDLICTTGTRKPLQ